MMTKTQDHVMTRARTKIQASGELNVEDTSSVNVFFGVRRDCEPASMTMVVVVDDRAEEGSMRGRGQIQISSGSPPGGCSIGHTLCLLHVGGWDMDQSKKSKSKFE